MLQAELAKDKQGPLGEFNSCGIVCGYSRRSDKNLSLNYGDTVDSLSSRRKFLNGMGIDYRNLVCAKQVHASGIAYVTHADLGRGALSCDTAIDNTDALISDKRNLPLAIFTADCLSVFLYDPLTPAVGLIHAGWRSTKDNISGKAIRLMQDQFGTDVNKLMLIFGPAIRECCYKVEENFKNYFKDIVERSGDYYLDLAGVNRAQVLDAGAKIENIFDSGVCTSCQNKDFFSFRREGASCGRLMSVVMLK